MDAKGLIEAGKTALGIEFGSTRIKAVLTDLDGKTLAIGFHDWENSLIDGIWTYSLEEIYAGLRGCYTSLRKEVEAKYGVTPTTYGALGISAMMHGYIALDCDGEMLAPFQTWRNSNTEQAADELTTLFDFNIPLRWTIAHLYQCVLDGEEHLKKLDFVTTLDSFIHLKLTGEKITGIGDAAGIFPIDSETMDYDQKMIDQFDALIAPKGYPWKTRDVLPKVLTAGQPAGFLTAEGAALLDESGSLKPGIPMCPSEGDAGTGMVATNSVAPRTGNVSAGTSAFAMIVLEKKLSKLYREIDMVTTPSGFPVAMSHANNGTSDLNAWVNIFREFTELMGIKADMGELYGKLYTNTLNGDADCGGLLSYGYLSGEGITHLNEGRPLFARTPDAKFTLANFMRAHLYTSLGAVKLGLDILLKEEGVKVDRILGHGGLFKTPGVAQRYLAAAVGAPVTCMDTASEGGPWGMAVLAAYMIDGAKDCSLEEYLEKKIFADQSGTTIAPEADEIAGFEVFTERYKAGIAAEKAAVDSMKW
ncbi:MAG: FGGY-family carbohydrate kinase [Lachnospiraceae bacterium]|nr:FGGY-family carbohydrate kinase [Lachnospiraceae bacterium]